MPLLPGENVITSNVVVKDGFIEVRLGAHQESFTWQSELTVTDIAAPGDRKPDDEWVERWHLVASPVWNVAITGLAPVFEAGNPELVPVWQPWPGESVELTISRPEAVAGATVTVDEGSHEITLGRRQRSSSLDSDAAVQPGRGFPGRPAGRGGHRPRSPQRPLDPGAQGRRPGDRAAASRANSRWSVGWKSDMPLGFRARAEEVRLPVESANIDTRIEVPDDRWVLWTGGPLRGPAVRFWGILVWLAAGGVGARPDGAARRCGPVEWMLLAIGLTQIPLPAALVVIGWLFFLRWRGGGVVPAPAGLVHNLLQVFLIGLTVVALGIFIAIVAAGLLGSPEMFIRGNGRPARCCSGIRRAATRAAAARLPVGLDLVVPLPDAGVGAVAGRLADPLAALGVAAVQRRRMFPSQGQSGGARRRCRGA